MKWSWMIAGLALCAVGLTGFAPTPAPQAAADLIGAAGYKTEPVWSPSGDAIAFVASANKNPDIFLIAADGSASRRLTSDPAVDYGPMFSPDGTKIAFWSDRDGNSEVYVMDADGGNARNLTRHPAHSPRAARSPAVATYGLVTRPQ